MKLTLDSSMRDQQQKQIYGKFCIDQIGCILNYWPVKCT